MWRKQVGAVYSILQKSKIVQKSETCKQKYLKILAIQSHLKMVARISDRVCFSTRVSHQYSFSVYYLANTVVKDIGPLKLLKNVSADYILKHSLIENVLA